MVDFIYEISCLILSYHINICIYNKWGDQKRKHDEK